MKKNKAGYPLAMVITAIVISNFLASYIGAKLRMEFWQRMVVLLFIYLFIIGLWIFVSKLIKKGTKE